MWFQNGDCYVQITQMMFECLQIDVGLCIDVFFEYLE